MRYLGTIFFGGALVLAASSLAAGAASAADKPNIIFIMGDDIGWSNIGVYNQGIMAGQTSISTGRPAD